MGIERETPMTLAQQQAGAIAKRVGHENEVAMCQWLNETIGGNHIVDGGCLTKQDIIETNTGVGYSLKSVSKNHTQCHLTSTARWVDFFGIEGDLKAWFDQFFGIPGQDVSEGGSRQHRLTSEQIESDLNQKALDWFNENRMGIFDVIVRNGMSDTPVQFMIWYTKTDGERRLINIDDLAEMVYNGEWILRGTTLHFISGGTKMFHLQMKGSGKKYTSGYHGMMFHIYN